MIIAVFPGKIFFVFQQNTMQIMLPQDDPIKTILAQREEQRDLCRQIEDIADRLPTAIGRNTFARIHSKLKRDLPTFNRNEELLYALVGAHWPNGSDFMALLSLIRMQHGTHNAFADEFDELFLYGNDQDPSCGYMLRYFFEMLRSHLDWEEAVVFPIAKSALKEAELQHLAAEMAASQMMSQYD